MKKSHLILIGAVLILLSIIAAVSITAFLAGLMVIGSCPLLFMTIAMVGGIIGCLQERDFGKDLIKAIIVLSLSVAGLVLLWTVFAHHPLIYPHLRDAGII